MVDLTESQCENLCDFIEFNIFEYIRNDTDIDNIDWLVDMMKAYQKLKEWNTTSKIIEQPAADVVEVIQSLWKKTANEKPDSTRHLIVANGSLISHYGYYLKPKDKWYKTFKCEEEIEVPAFWMDMPEPPKESIYGECAVMDKGEMQDDL